LQVVLADAGAAPQQDDRPSPALLAPRPRQASAEGMRRIDLKDAKDGSGDLVYEETTFTARIAPDGSVSFKDRRVSNPSLLPFLPMRTQFGVPSLQSSLKGLLKGKHPPAPGPSE